MVHVKKGKNGNCFGLKTVTKKSILVGCSVTRGKKYLHLQLLNIVCFYWICQILIFPLQLNRKVKGKVPKCVMTPGFKLLILSLVMNRGKKKCPNHDD